MTNKLITLLTLLLCLCPSSGWAKDFVVKRGDTVLVFMPAVNRPVAGTALEMLCDDMQQVLGCQPTKTSAPDKAKIVLGIDTTLNRQGFHWEVENGILYLNGADAHGLAYGMMEMSRKLGVSPWVYWADCLPEPLKKWVIKDKHFGLSYPSVRYRGIFINDEDWGLNPWATRREPEAWTLKHGRIKGAVGPKTTEEIFKLMLRLCANYYWPPMHECSQPFFTIEGNREMAAKYGIYVGGSHCEPMATSPAAEWSISGNGDYNYVSNAQSVKEFWHKRIEEVKEQEIVYTLGMRGVHDGAMQGVKTADDKLKYLQQVIDDQRDMLKEVNADVTQIPQVFVPYKEVLDIYRSGLSVPDDVTLMWTDDNYGYIRQFPDSAERARKGGNGLYYHISYWGRPHDYLWLNSFSPRLLISQLQRAWWNGIREMWVLNVGDIKPSEYQIDLFMQRAWNGFWYKKSVLMPEKAKEMICKGHLQHFAMQHFGKKHAKEIAAILDEYFTLSAEIKPEFLAGTRVEESDKVYWNQIRPMPGDWTQPRVADRVARYQAISDAAEKLYSEMPDNRKDAFFELVKYPVQAVAQMNFKFLDPARSTAAYDSIQMLTYIYNKVCAGGKWDGIMSAAPRNLTVFNRIDPAMLPTYPASSSWQPLPTKWGRAKIKTQVSEDSITLRLHLTPNHPVEGTRLAFCIEIDNERSQEYEFQTVGRSEEWKQNVLRGYAIREVTLPLTKQGRKHTIQIIPTTPGVELQQLLIRR